MAPSEKKDKSPDKSPQSPENGKSPDKHPANPDDKVHKRCKHYSTTTRIAIRSTLAFLKARDIPHTKTDVFRFNGVEYRSGHRILREETIGERRAQDPSLPETRGRKALISTEQKEMIRGVIERAQAEGRYLSYKELAQEAQMTCSLGTLKRACELIGLKKCTEQSCIHPESKNHPFHGKGLPCATKHARKSDASVSAMPNGQPGMGHAPPSLANGQSPLPTGQPSLGNGQPSLGNGQSTLGNAQPALGTGQPAQPYYTLQPPHQAMPELEPRMFTS